MAEGARSGRWVGPRDGMVAGLVGGAGLTWATAWVIRRQHRLLADLSEAQQRLAREARSAERALIAREIHDVIAHSLTVTLLHLSSARLAVTDRPADAIRALGEAELHARQSLSDVRRTVGLLGPAGPAGRSAPLPGVADLPRLAREFRSAGIDVALTVTGDRSELPPATGLAVYRIVEEATTNAARHAVGSSIDVAVDVGPRATAVRVVNGPGRDRKRIDLVGRPVPSPSPSSSVGPGGLGIVGMRERAHLLGGRLAAGPRPDGGWEVEAVLPRTGPVRGDDSDAGEGRS